MDTAKGMTMIERVARAIDGERWDAFDRYCQKKEFDAHEKAERMNDSAFIKGSLNRARAAIQAMREITPHMRDAVDKAEAADGYCFAAYEHIEWDDAWPIAIDAALSETSEDKS